MIDAHALIDPRASIDSSVTVGPFAVIGPEVRIDADTWIGPHVVINGPTRIGKANKIYQFASLGEIPQDKKYAGEHTELVIGDGNSIREFCTINRGTAAAGRTLIGDDNWIMAYVHIAHDCQLDDHTVLANGATLAGHVVIEDHAVLGGFTLVHQFCRIGTHAFCGMGSALSRDLPPYVLAAGNLAKPHGINKEGLRRRGFTEEVIVALHRAYKLLFKTSDRDGEPTHTLDELRERHAEVARLMTFMETSSRGVIR